MISFNLFTISSPCPVPSSQRDIRLSGENGFVCDRVFSVYPVHLMLYIEVGDVKDRVLSMEPHVIDRMHVA